MKMTTKEMIEGVLTDHSCLTAKEIANFIYRFYGEHITPASVSGSIRSMYAQGKVAKDQSLKGTVYWLTTLNEKRVIVK